MSPNLFSPKLHVHLVNIVGQWSYVRIIFLSFLLVLVGKLTSWETVVQFFSDIELKYKGRMVADLRECNDTSPGRVFNSEKTGRMPYTALIT